MNDVYLISCTKKKQNYSCRAEEMYQTSKLFRESFNYALSKVNNKESQIFILSAKYYLLALSENIEPYDKTLKNMGKCEKNQWGKCVYEKMKKRFDLDNTRFIFLAGNDYINPLLPFLKDIKWLNPIPQEFRAIGKRIKWLKQNGNK